MTTAELMTGIIDNINAAVIMFAAICIVCLHLTAFANVVHLQHRWLSTKLLTNAPLQPSVASEFDAKAAAV